MKNHLSVALIAAVALAGCVTPFRPPADLAHIKLTVANSPLVSVEKAWLERKNGPLVIRGYVVRQLEADDTSNTHLDVTLYGANGEVLRKTVEHFEPRQIPGGIRRHNDASYRVPLDPLPKETARIEVRAHEGAHRPS
jgi:hypothetical protein